MSEKHLTETVVVTTTTEHYSDGSTARMEKTEVAPAAVTEALGSPEVQEELRPIAASALSKEGFTRMVGGGSGAIFAPLPLGVLMGNLRSRVSEILAEHREELDEILRPQGMEWSEVFWDYKRAFRADAEGRPLDPTAANEAREQRDKEKSLDAAIATLAALKAEEHRSATGER